MIKTLQELNAKEQFRPTALSLFYNGNYFIKKGIYEGIRRNAHYMRGTLLDFGCGNKPYESLFKVDQYIGIDMKEVGHDHTNESVDVYYDGKHIPFDDSHFDCVFSSEVFEHVFNLEEMLREISRVLKNDGVLLITLPFVWYEHEIPHDFARYSSYGIQDLMKRHGFEIVVIEKTSNWPVTIIQLCNSFLYHLVFPKNTILKMLLSVLIIFPLNLLGLLLSGSFKGHDELYLNNVVLAKKAGKS